MADPLWRSIEPVENCRIEIEFGDEVPWSGEARGIGFPEGGKALWIDFTDSLFLEEFMSEEDVTVRYRGDDIATCPLADSYSAGAALVECQKIMNEYANELDPFGSSAEEEADDHFASP